MSNLSKLNKVRSITDDPESTVHVVGPQPIEERSLIKRMNNKVKSLLVIMVSIPVLMAWHQTSHPEKPVVGQPVMVQLQKAPPVVKAEVAVQKVAAVEVKKEDEWGKALPNNGEGMKNFEMAQALEKVDLFASMATAVEDYKKKPYYDPGGLNVGMGYCITKRIAEYGKDRVADDLKTAGFSEQETEDLIKNKKDKVSKINVNALMAVKLLEVTKKDYRGIAMEAIGEKVFNKLPDHRQAALTYLAYNTGNVGQFKKLVSAVNKGDDSTAMMNLKVNWKDKEGEWHANHRQRSYLQALFLGVEHFKRAIKDPNQFEGYMAKEEAEEALAVIAGAAQKPEGLKSKLLERRIKSNPWAFKALVDEKEKVVAKPK